MIVLVIILLVIAVVLLVAIFDQLTDIKELLAEKFSDGTEDE